MDKVKEHEFLLFSKDKIIKTILLDEVVIKNNDFHLFERLIKDACGLKIKVIRLLPTELPVQKAIERAKRLDFLVECDGKYVHMEVNTAWEESTKMRNKSYFFSFYSQVVNAGEDYDEKTEFIQIQFNYGMPNKYGLCEILDEYSGKNYELFLKNIKLIHVNLDKFGKIWYDNVAKRNMNGSLPVLFALKTKEDILAYNKAVNDSDVKECVEKLSKLNSDFKFVWDYEKNEKVYENSLKKEYLNKGIEQGIEQGIEEGIENTAVNMLRKNMDINLISEVTKLDLEKIQKLKTRIELEEK